MYSHIKIEKILFLDIETVPQQINYESLNDDMKRMWDMKVQNLVRYENHGETNSPSELYARAGIYAEFGKIICISVGYIRDNVFRIKSFYSDDEKEILINFASLVNEHFSSIEHRLCGHNLKEFDLPYICRRMLINDIKIPHIMNLSGKKPWENPHLDTLELWKFGDYKHFISLELMATIFNINSPKNDIKGKDVRDVYWKNNDLKRIVDYCEKDTLTVAQILLKITGNQLIKEENIIKK
jgi:uncharacterized protein YprB with RNaseH-like and TPR domain